MSSLLIFIIYTYLPFYKKNIGLKIARKRGFMAVKMGRGDRSWSRVLPPSNRGMGHIAKTRLSQLVGAANDRHREALTVENNSFWVWLRRKAGAPCTCSVGRSRKVSIDQDALDEATGPEGASTVDKPMKALRLRPVSGNGFLDLNNLRDIHRGLMDEKEKDPTSQATRDRQTDLSVEGQMDDLIMPHDTVDPDNPGYSLADQVYGTGEEVRCGICLGTHFNEGYNLWGGKRIVLDATDRYKYTLHAVEINTETAPYTFVGNSLNGPNYVMWSDIEIPTYHMGVLTLKISNNANIVKSRYKLEVRRKGDISWSELTPTFFNVLNGSSLIVDIRVIMTSEEDLVFTHLDLVFQLTNPVKGAVPNLNRSANWDQWQALIVTNIEIPARIPGLDRECILQDGKFNLMWSVVDAERWNTQIGQDFNNNLSCRMLNRDDIRRVLSIGTIVNPLPIPFRTLEKQQGLPNPHRNL